MYNVVPKKNNNLSSDKFKKPVHLKVSMKTLHDGLNKMKL